MVVEFRFHIGQTPWFCSWSRTTSLFQTRFRKKVGMDTVQPFAIRGYEWNMSIGHGIEEELLVNADR
jgi:hypothetical protein